MLIAVDIGNTNIVVGVFSGQELVCHWRLGAVHGATTDEYAITLRSLFDSSCFELSDLTGSIVSSVVPSMTGPFIEALSAHTATTPLVVGPGTRTGMPILTDDPREVGADRIVNAVAAYSIYKKELIVVDFGTAVTFDYVTPHGEYAGGAIAPGIDVSIEALFQKAAKLSRVEVSRPKSVVGKSTVESMRSGIFYGFVGLVDGVVEKMKQEVGTNPLVVATGGASRVVAKGCDSIDEVDEFLTLKGLRIIYEENR